MLQCKESSVHTFHTLETLRKQYVLIIFLAFKKQKQVTLSSLQTIQVTVNNNTFPDLNVKNPKLWWPWQMGSQHLYNLSISFLPGKLLWCFFFFLNDITTDDSSNFSDSLTIPFGIREVTSFINENGYRQYQVNGQNILIRGAGYEFIINERSLTQSC